MKNKDQKRLEMLYESMSSPVVLLDQEKKFCRRVVEGIIKQSRHFNSDKRNIDIPLSVYLNYSGENFGSYQYNNKYVAKIYDALEEEIDIPSELENVKRNIYISECYNQFADATHLGLYKDDEENSKITFHTPRMEVIAKVPYKDKQDWQKFLLESLELFLIDCLERVRDIVNNKPRLTNPHFEQSRRFWKWREEKAKFEVLRKKLPELEGIFE